MAELFFRSQLQRNRAGLMQCSCCFNVNYSITLTKIHFLKDSLSMKIPTFTLQMAVWNQWNGILELALTVFLIVLGIFLPSKSS